MDTSARPIALHVGLQYVCRVHGLTPHSSTGRCPFELIREGPTASLFPQLTKSTQKAAELTAVRQSVSGSGKRVAFKEGDRVIVYDFKSKLSALGIIKEVLGSNTYMVDSGNGPRHVSGDALSRSSLDAEDIVGKPGLTAQDSQDSQDSPQALVQDSDDSGADSDSSSDGDYVQDLVPAAVPCRRRRVRQQDLGPICNSRLRQRH